MSRRMVFLGSTIWAMGLLMACSGVTPPGLGSNCPEPQAANAQPDAGADAGNETPVTRTDDIAVCSAGIAQADIDKNLAMVPFVDADFHEMVVCGGLASNFAYTLMHFFANIACGIPPTPLDFLVAGLGVYQVGQVMSVQVKLAKDGPLGKAGDDVPFDVFNPASYFKAATIKANLTANASWNSSSNDFNAHLEGDYEMELEGPIGEALSLWELPADGKGIKISQAKLVEAIGRNVALVLDINTESSQGTKYRIVTDNLSLSDIYTGKPMPMPVTDIVATGPDPSLNQITQLVDWNMVYIPTQFGMMDGSITLKVNGGFFPYYMKFTYPNRSAPDILVSCNPPPP